MLIIETRVNNLIDFIKAGFICEKGEVIGAECGFMLLLKD